MRVFCLANDSQSLSARHFEFGYTYSSEFDLEIGKDYVVYGISLWNGLLAYLVIGEGKFPHWYPAELFRVYRDEMPAHWHFAYFNQNQDLTLNAVWGYPELTNVDHFDGLSNLEDQALIIFEERRIEIEKVS